MDLRLWKPSSSTLPRVRTEKDIDQFQRRMNNMMSSFLNQWDLDRWDSSKTTPFEFGYYPSVNIQEKDAKYILDADVPGLAESDLEIDFRNNTLTLKGEKKSEVETKDADTICIERSCGDFRRDISFAEEIDADTIKADLKNGVLHVELPKKEKGKSSFKKIPIKHLS